MKAAWDWHLPVATREDQEAVANFAAELGFDTLIAPNPSEEMVDRGRALGLKVIAIVYGRPSDTFAEKHPECLQKILSGEEGIQNAVAEGTPQNFQLLSHRWFSVVQAGEAFCFDHEASREALKEEVRKAVESSDGVSFDGFGFRNHYGCFCERCKKKRKEIAKENPDLHEPEVLARQSEDSLVEISRVLNDAAKSVNPNAVVTNHLWPPFYPNEYYGWRLKMDYCTQTISWFYRPNWSLERVEFETSEMKRLEDRSNNTFVPFIGLYDQPYLVRTPERVEQEFEIAARHGDGHVVLCNLATPRKYPQIAEVVKQALFNG